MQVNSINNNVSFKGSVVYLTDRAKNAASNDACVDVSKTLKAGVLYEKLPGYHITVGDCGENYISSLFKTSKTNGSLEKIGKFKDFNIHESLSKACTFAIGDAQVEKFNPFKQSFFKRILNIFKRV